MKKFELTEQKIKWYGRTLYRIRACTDFVNAFGREVHVGDFGGFVEDKSNLSDYGTAWIFDEAKVYDNAMVYGDAEVCNNAEVRGSAAVCGHAMIHSNAQVYDSAKIYGNTIVYDDAKIWGNAKIYGGAKIWGNAEVHGGAEVGDSTEICGNAFIFSNKHILYLSPIDKYGNSVTLFRTKEYKIKISIDHKIYTVEDFKEMISKWDDIEREVATGVIEIAQKYIDLSEEK